MADNSNFIYTLYNITSWPNDTVFFDEPGSCFNMDCIWDRARKERLHIMRPLTILLCIIGILGIVGNIFVILVYSRSPQKRTSTYLVVMLAVIDLIACGLVIPGTLMKEWLMKFRSDVVCKITELIRNFVIVCSAMILAAIAFDRFLLVYRKNVADGNKKIMLAVSLVIILISIILGVPPMLGVGVYMKQSIGDAELINIKVCLPNELLISEDDLHVYWKVITAFFSLLIITIIILYMLIFVKVYTHIHNNKLGVNAAQMKRRSISNSFLLFVGISPSARGTTHKTNTANNKLSPHGMQITQSARRPAAFKTLRKLFNKHKPKLGNDVITVNIISNTTSDVTSRNSDPIDPPPQIRSTRTHRRGSMGPLQSHQTGSTRTQSPIPGPSHRRGSNLSPSHADVTSPKTPSQKTPSQTESNRCSPHQQQTSVPLRNQCAHIKTTQVLCIITTVYIAAFLPMFLVTHRVIERNEIIFYLYFINNAANPIIYSFMNRKFRRDIWKMFSCRKHRVRPAQ